MKKAGILFSSLRAEGGARVVEGVVGVRFPRGFSYHAVLQLGDLLLQLKDGIVCVVRLAERRPISRTDPKFALIPKQEEHEQEDSSDGCSPGQVDVQVDGQVAVGVEQPGQLLGLLHEDIVVDQILDCAQDTGCGHR